MPAVIQLKAIAAIMLGVRDLDKALEFYQAKLGLRVIMKEPSLALLQCGAVMLGLSRGHVNLAPHVSGATEVVFAVDNVRAAHQALSAEGIAFMSEPRQATPTDWVAHFKDVDGHILSVFGPEGQS